MRRGALLVWAFAFSPACEPKEARDPSEIIAEDPSFLPAEYGGVAAEERDAGAAPAVERPATRGDCEAAARHLEELAHDLAIAEARSPEQRAELETRKRTLLRDPASKARIDRSAAECLARETSAREARCVSRIRRPEEIEDCAR